MAFRASIVLFCIAVLLGSCSGEQPDPDSLESISISVGNSDGILVSVPLHPADQPFVVTRVEPVVDDDIRAEYLGYVTRCAGLCGVHDWDEDLRQRITAAVEGTIPFEVTRASEGSHLLILLRPTRAGRERLDDGECFVMDGVDLAVDGGEPVRLTRQGFRFMWLLSGGDDDCGEMQILQY